MVQTKLIPWQYSDAKELLERDILNGKTKGKKPKQVYEMHAMYKQYVYDNFCTNLNNLKKLLQELQDHTDEDEAAFLHDKALKLCANNMLYPQWGGSVTKCFLKIDIDAGKEKTMKPHKLQEMWQEYLPYPPKVFHDHVQ